MVIFSEEERAALQYESVERLQAALDQALEAADALRRKADQAMLASEREAALVEVQRWESIAAWNRAALEQRKLMG